MSSAAHDMDYMKKFLKEVGLSISDIANINTSTTTEPYQNVCLFDDDNKRKSKLTVLIEIGEQLEKFHDSNG